MKKPLCRKRILALLLAFCFLLSACGNDTSDESESTEMTEEEMLVAEYEKKGFSVCRSEVTGEVSADYDSVMMGGGGYVSAIIIHPLDSDIKYIRTDVGGCYRWDSKNEKWIQLSLSVGAEAMGVAGMAVDPKDKDIVYACFGTNGGLGVYKSYNRGDTWEATELKLGYFGNDFGKEFGECIAVDPVNSNIVFCGSPKSGSYFSEDAGKTWTAFKNLGSGLFSIAFDPSSEKDGRCQTIYIASHGTGLRRSDDGGKTWKLYKNGAAAVTNVRVANDGVGYLTSAWGIHRIDGDELIDITPKGYDRTASALAVDPYNSKRIAFSGMISKSDGTYDPMRIPIYYSNNGGETWVNCLEGTRNNTVPWWPDYYFSSATSGMAFCGKELYFTDWYGVWVADDVDAGKKKTWTNIEKGHEEMVSFSAITAPTKDFEVMFAQADNGIITYKTDIDQYPLSRDGNGQFMDYCAAEPGLIVAAGGTNNSGNAATVMRYEKTGKVDEKGREIRHWVVCPGWKSNIICHDVAVSSDNPDCMVVTVENKAPYYSHDGGKTWLKANAGFTCSTGGYWSRMRTVASDKVRAGVFYISAGGKFYRSEDYGVTWEAMNDYASGSAVLTYGGKADEIWIDGENPLHSTDGGKTWTALPDVSGSIALGAAKDGDGYTLCLMGTVKGGKSGVYYSEDCGKTWTYVDNGKGNFYVAECGIYGDCNRFGRMYFCTGGFGWLYIQVKE